MSNETQNAESLPAPESAINVVFQNPTIKKILNAFPYVIAIYDNNYNILFLNKAGYKFSDLPAKTEKNHKCFEMLGRNTPCQNCSEYIALKKSSFTYKTYLSSSSKNVCLQPSFVYGSNGKLEYIIEYIRFYNYEKSCFLEQENPTNLEILIAERTEDLMASNEELQAEVMERIRIENELRETQMTFNSLIETIPEVVYLKDLKGRNLVSNKAFEKLVGIQKNDIIGKTDAELFTPTLANMFGESDQEVIQTKKSHKVVVNFIDSEGNKKYYETIKTPILDSNQNVEGVVGLSRDITEQKISEESLKISRNELAQTYDYIHNLMELSPIATLSLDNKQRIITINQKTIDMLGYGVDELIGAPFLGLLAKPDNYINGSSTSFILEFVAKDGTSVVANVSQSVINKAGFEDRTVVTIQNISDLRGLFVDPLQEESLEDENNLEDQYVELEPGCIYFIDDVDTEQSYHMFSNMVKSGVPGLCITRQNPARVRSAHGLLKTPFIWFTKNQNSEQPFIDSSELYKLQPTIYNFIDKVQHGVVFLDGLEYLSLDNDIKSVIKAIEEVNDSVMNSNSSMMIHINSLALDTKEFHLMTRWMKPVKCL